MTAEAAHHRWPLWRVILVYAIFAAVASGSVVIIDRNVMRAAARYRSIDRP